ncbi:hypothetical protein BC830DRAFT_1135233 [Chytriomyces sp. MP71]|nr:hypothetical protein BC830DRAFT_1135233 [Chytriomyces sp. MP71]
MAEEWEDCPDTDAEWAILDLDGFSAEAVKESAKQHGGVSLIGLDSPTPFLRIGNMHFKGSYDAPLGSDLIFATSANQAIQPRLRGPFRIRLLLGGWYSKPYHRHCSYRATIRPRKRYIQQSEYYAGSESGLHGRR